MSAYSFPIGSATDSDVTAITQAAHGLSVGDWVRMDGTDYVLAQADTDANAEVVGVVSAVTDVDNFTLTTGGLVTGLSGLTAGAIHYLDDAVAGALIDTDTAAVSKPVLIARTTTTGYVFNGFGSGGNGAAFSAGVSNLGNTAGATGVSGTRMVMVGSGPISLSQTTGAAGNTVSVLGPATSSLVGVSGASVSTNGSTISIIGSPFSGGVSNVGNTAGNTGITGSRLVFAGTNGITLSQSTNASGGTISISGATQTLQTSNVHNVTLSGNTAGAMAQVSSGTMTLAGGNNITLSQAGNAITISGANVGGAQTGISSIVASDATYTSGSVQFTGSGIVTVRSSANQRVVIDASQSVQPETQTFIAGISASDTLYTSGNVRLTGVGGGITVSSNTGQRVDLSVAAQSVQPGVQQIVASNASFSSGTVSISGFGDVTVNTAAGIIRISAPVQTAQTGLSGLANSQTTYTSGTVSLSELGAITIRSTTGNQFQLSVNAQSVQPETQTFIAGVSASDTLYTSGNVRITGVGGGITVSSNTGQRVDLSVAAQSVQPGIQNLVASNATFSSGTVSISGFGDITVNTAANIIRISGPVQTAETAISGLANSQTTYTSGTVSLSELGAITIRSTTGNQFQFSVNPQTEQTQSRFNLTLSGNTAGAMALISSGVMTLAGGNGVTLSQAGNAVTISGGAGGAAFSAGMSTEGNTAGATGVSGTRMVLVGSGPVSLSQTTGAAGNTVSILAPAVSSLVAGANITVSTDGSTISIIGGAGAGFSGGVSDVGNTVGDTGITGSRLVLAGGNGITLSQSTNASGGTVTISGITQSVQPGVQQLVASNASFSSGTVSISGFGDVTVNTAAGIIRISAPVQTAQTGISGVANSETTYTSGTVSLSELGAITIRSTTGNQYQFSVAAQTAQTGISSIVASDATYTSGSVQFTGSNMVTVKSSANQRVVIDATQSVQPGVQRWVASDASFSSGTVSISGFGDVTVNTAANIIRISAPAQTVQPGVQHLVASDNTFSSGTVSISGFGDITVNTAGSLIRVSGPVQTVESHSIGASNLGNTLGTSGVASGGQVRGIIVGTSNITVSQSVNGASATLSLIGQPGFSGGVSNIGNTGGDTGVTATRLVFVGSNNVTLSQTTGANGATIGLNAAGGGAGQFSGGVSTGGNTAGATGITGSQMVLVGSGPISLSQTTGANGGTVSINAPATSSLVGGRDISISTNGSTISVIYRNTLADWQNFPRGQASLLSNVGGFSKTPIYWEDHLDGDVLAKSMAFAVSMVTANSPLSVSVHLGLYTLVNSTSAALLGSHSEAYHVSSATSVSFSGARNFVMTGIGTHGTLSSLNAGEYVFGMMFSATATNAMNFSIMGASGGPTPLGGVYPGTNAVSAGTSQGIQALRGRGSTTVNAMPAGIVATEIVNQGSGASAALHPWIYIRS